MAKMADVKRFISLVAMTNIFSGERGLGITVLLSGPHGVGKSSIVKRCASKLNGVLMTIEASQIGEGTITGLPFAMKDENGKSEVRFIKYYVFSRIETLQASYYKKAASEGFLDGRLKLNPETNEITYKSTTGEIQKFSGISSAQRILEGDDNKYKFGENLPSGIKKELIASGEIQPVFVFIDEINRADIQAQKECMNIILNRSVNGYDLPWWVEIVAAMNPSSQNSSYAVNEMDPAQLDRFLKIKVKADAEDWGEYMLEKYRGSAIVNAVVSTGMLNDKKDGSLEDQIEMTPSPRSWEMLENIYDHYEEYVDFEIKGKPVFDNEERSKIDSDIRSLFIGKVGGAAATTVLSFISNKELNVAPKEIFTLKKNYVEPAVMEKIKKMKGFTKICTATSVINWLTDNMPEINSYKNDKSKENREKYTNFVAQFKQFVTSGLDISTQTYFASYLIRKQVLDKSGVAVFTSVGDFFAKEVLLNIREMRSGLKSLN